MSFACDIDNEDPLQLSRPDSSHESLMTYDHLEASARKPHNVSSCHDLSSDINRDLDNLWSRDLLNEMLGHSTDDKGKSVSQPVPITTMRGVLVNPPAECQEDIFSISLGSASSSRIHESPGPSSRIHESPGPSSSPSSSTECNYLHLTVLLPSTEQESDDTVGGPSPNVEGKGKSREMPPILPPLSFISSELQYGSTDWPSLDLSSSPQGPSSYGSSCGQVLSPGSSYTIPSNGSIESPEVTDVSSPPACVLSRGRTLYNPLSNIKQSTSATTTSPSKSKTILIGSKGPSNLARKLVFRKRSHEQDSQGDLDREDPSPRIEPIGVPSSCLTPWAYDGKAPRISPICSPAMELDLSILDGNIPFYYAGRSSDNSLLRTKGRSYSSPLPLPTALDLIPATTTDIFKPIPVSKPNYFDDYLPVELRLRVFAFLVLLHQTEHQRNVLEGRWTVRKATSSRNKWVGYERGIRELFKLSRVSKGWRALVFDGQLWSNLDLHSFSKLPSAVLEQLSSAAGSFTNRLDLSGHNNLTSQTLIDVTDNICSSLLFSSDHSFHTRLTSVNLQGCSGLTTSSFHHLLMRSPSLRELYIKGLSAATNTTFDILATHCPSLVTLDASRCPHITGDGLLALVTAVVFRHEHLPLKVLKISGIRRLSANVMATLARAAPDLEVLDISYSRDLHNSALEAFTSSSESDAANFKVMPLTAREAGRGTNDSSTYWRRVTRLRHLSLSCCILLTDHACSHLAHAVPKLELLEMAGIGAGLQDQGLVRLLNTTPHIRRLDLEDASQITDAVISAITPDPVIDAPPPRVAPPSQPGHALEHLVISSASEVTNEAMSALIQNCTRLRVLEADNTRLSGPVVKEFVRSCREREMADAQVVAIDCRGVGEQTVKDISDEMRPRIGWRSYEARKLGFLDARDEEDLGVGQDECDGLRVAVKTFFSWQTVDAVRAARDKKRRSNRRNANGSNSSMIDDSRSSTGRARWWSPGGRRSGTTSPITMDMNNDRDSCTIM